MRLYPQYRTNFRAATRPASRPAAAPPAAAPAAPQTQTFDWAEKERRAGIRPASDAPVPIPKPTPIPPPEQPTAPDKVPHAGATTAADLTPGADAILRHRRGPTAEMPRRIMQPYRTRYTP